MAEDRVPPPPGSPEEPLLDISSEDLAVETPSPAAPELPAAPVEPHHDDQEVTLVQEPPAPAGPLAPPPPPVIPEPIAPPIVVEPEPPAPTAYQPPPVPSVVEATPAMASDQWYTSSAGQVYGPYNAADIRAWLQSGQVSWDTPASRGGDDPWRPLSAIAEFNPAPAYGVPIGAVAPTGQKERLVAGILAIALGIFGAHHWYLGNYVLAGIYLGITLLLGSWTFWFFGGFLGPVWIVSIIEGIIYLTAPEDRFQRNYHNWFLSGP